MQQTTLLRVQGLCLAEWWREMHFQTSSSRMKIAHDKSVFLDPETHLGMSAVIDRVPTEATSLRPLMRLVTFRSERSGPRVVLCQNCLCQTPHWSAQQTSNSRKGIARWMKKIAQCRSLRLRVYSYYESILACVWYEYPTSMDIIELCGLILCPFKLCLDLGNFLLYIRVVWHDLGDFLLYLRVVWHDLGGYRFIYK